MAPPISGTIAGTGTVEHFRIGTATTVESFELPPSTVSAGIPPEKAPPASPKVLALLTGSVESVPERNWAHLRHTGNAYAQQVLEGHRNPDTPEQSLVFGEAVTLLNEESEKRKLAHRKLAECSRIREAQGHHKAPPPKLPSRPELVKVASPVGSPLGTTEMVGITTKPQAVVLKAPTTAVVSGYRPQAPAIPPGYAACAGYPPEPPMKAPLRYRLERHSRSQRHVPGIRRQSPRGGRGRHRY